jgi:TonB family protein
VAKAGNYGGIDLNSVRKIIAEMITAALFISVSCLLATSQEAISRHVKSRVPPAYPDMARRYGISGTVRLAVVVSPNGTVKNATATGGHPVLVNAAVDAVKKWKFEPASEETTGTVEIKFAAAQDN